ncbi:serine/threonine protein phosphatase [Flavobacterium sp. MAH-1]|uniref:Serine/threonine protein phosphatase n=1 Tax=Flavobacterium agri TaxID=2743471 RepID=A0A7Y8Y2F5_9FLAO|nr:metallophosphoesterase family protein [Flavobacterium agri]NUY81253.1 serine/threonine protein phosphatase [Flavobacterium agri]NYA71277.1 serine/threonine protein phosphatase [Flavobacterium agri]
MNRTLVIGDIHGGLRALEQVFERADVSTDDKLIFLGDYVDGWSESPQVLDYLMALSQTHECIFLRGNHDDLLMEWLRGKENKLWHQHGGEATILAYSILPETIKEHHIAFLDSLRNYYLDGQKRLFVHAGFTNLHGVDYEYYPRLLFWERTLWETALALDPKIGPDHILYPKRFTVYNEIYIGHTPVTRIDETTPQNRANVWNIDTGAAFKGKLSVLDIETKQFWQSDCLPDLYPNEIGRNK